MTLKNMLISALGNLWEQRRELTSFHLREKEIYNYVKIKFVLEKRRAINLCTAKEFLIYLFFSSEGRKHTEEYSQVLQWRLLCTFGSLKTVNWLSRQLHNRLVFVQDLCTAHLLLGQHDFQFLVLKCVALTNPDRTCTDLS